MATHNVQLVYNLLPVVYFGNIFLGEENMSLRSQYSGGHLQSFIKVTVTWAPYEF